MSESKTAKASPDARPSENFTISTPSSPSFTGVSELKKSTWVCVHVCVCRGKLGEIFKFPEKTKDLHSGHKYETNTICHTSSFLQCPLQWLCRVGPACVLCQHCQRLPHHLRCLQSEESLLVMHCKPARVHNNNS